MAVKLSKFFRLAWSSSNFDHRVGFHHEIPAFAAAMKEAAACTLEMTVNV